MRFCRLIDLPQRTWRRWQAKTRAGGGRRGGEAGSAAANEATLKHASAHPVWGTARSGRGSATAGMVSEATVLRLLREEGLTLPAERQRERRRLAERRQAAQLHHARARVRSPGQNGSRERGFGTQKYERLFIDEIDDAVMLAKHAEEYRIEYNTIRPHGAIAWNRPREVHLATPTPRPHHPDISHRESSANSLTPDRWKKALNVFEITFDG
jgi:hypothetical protein